MKRIFKILLLSSFCLLLVGCEKKVNPTKIPTVENVMKPIIITPVIAKEEEVVSIPIPTEVPLINEEVEIENTEIIVTPTLIPTEVPTVTPTVTPTLVPTSTPTPMPTVEPTEIPILNDIPIKEKESCVSQATFSLIETLFKKNLNKENFKSYNVYFNQYWKVLENGNDYTYWDNTEINVDEDTTFFDSYFTFLKNERLKEDISLKYYIQKEHNKNYMYIYNDMANCWGKYNTENKAIDLKLYNLNDISKDEYIVFKRDEERYEYNVTIKKSAEEIEKLIDLDLNSLIKPYFSSLQNENFIFDITFVFDIDSQKLLNVFFDLNNNIDIIKAFYVEYDFNDFYQENLIVESDVYNYLLDFSNKDTLAEKYKWKKEISYEELKEYFKISNKDILAKIKNIVETYTLLDFYNYLIEFENLTDEDKAIIYIMKNCYCFVPMEVFDYIGINKDIFSEDIVNLAESWR